MAPQFSTQLQFGELLSNTFPGFFSALTLFMLVDVLSPENLTLLVNRDITSLLGFIGFVFLVGTIIGVIIDGVHHSFIEEKIFCRLLMLKIINEYRKAILPYTDLKIGYQYYFEEIGDKAIDIQQFLQNTKYRYSEFHANTFISLIPFSLVAPFYLYYVLQIPWKFSLPLTVILFIVAFACLKSSYENLIDYRLAVFSYICGYLKLKNYIKLRHKSISDQEKFELEATIHDGASQLRMLKTGTRINFEATLGHVDLENKGETDMHGVARATLRRNNTSGTAIITATCKGCIPGITHVELK